jgi:importin subunit beta-1
MKALLASMDRPDAVEGNLRVSAMSAAAELVTASCPDVHNILRELLPTIVQRVDQALKMECLGSEDRENKEQMVGLLSGLFTALFQRLDKKDLLPHADSVMTAIISVLQVQNATCHEEAFLAVGAIATALEDDFVVS